MCPSRDLFIEKRFQHQRTHRAKCGFSATKALLEREDSIIVANRFLPIYGIGGSERLSRHGVYICRQVEKNRPSAT